jgi:MFS family permease
MVPFGGFLLLAGRTGDMLGRRRVLLAGTVLFTIASVASGLAPNAGVMVATRAAEGLAAGFVVPMTLALLARVFPAGPARTRAFSVWGGISAAAGTLGLILVPTSIASMSGSTADGSGVASALMNASRQLGGALGLAAISAVVASRTGVLQLRGATAAAAMTSGFHTGFVVSAALVAASVLGAIILLRETGRGERVSLIDLQTADA